jgi:hypothetical protein
VRHCGSHGRAAVLFLMLMDALGNCAPDAGCHKGFLSMVLLPAVLIAAPIGLCVRWLINQNWRDGS